MDNTKQIDFQLLNRVTKQALQNPKFFCSENALDPPEDSDIRRAARWVCRAEQLGLGVFGVKMLVRELKRVLEVCERTDSERLHEKHVNGRGVVDSSFLPGQVALAMAVRSALNRVNEHGITAVSLHNVGALGVLGLAVRDLAVEGVLGITCATSPAVVAPWGGTEPAIGTNPIAFAGPRAGAVPLVLDFATSPLTVAALRVAKESESPVDKPGGFTTKGMATQEAAEIHAIAPESRIASLTGFSVEMLTLAVAGSADSHIHGARTAVLMAVDPTHFGTASFANDLKDLASRWSKAGGHVPSRFDQIENLENEGNVDIDVEAWDALQFYASDWS